VTVEPRPGGRWYETDADGRESEWVTVLAWEPPHRVLLAWKIDARWEFSPLASSELEIVFREVDERLYSPDLDTSLAGLNASVEAVVREVPAQYQWEYKRFKRQPEGMPRPY
jgi:uncharacterized protein YndB with AHSA1/START domain